MFVIDDELHAEHRSDFDSFEEAMEQLKEWSTIPWDQPPNLAPCTGWRDCGRNYAIIEYDDAEVPWKELTRTPVLRITKSGAEWLTEFP